MTEDMVKALEESLALIETLQDALKQTRAKLREVDEERQMWNQRSIKLGWHRE